MERKELSQNYFGNRNQTVIWKRPFFILHLVGSGLLRSSFHQGRMVVGRGYEQRMHAWQVAFINRWKQCAVHIIALEGLLSICIEGTMLSTLKHDTWVQDGEA
jgi:hypothetical protein